MNSKKKKYNLFLAEDYDKILKIYEQRLNDLKKQIDKYINILISEEILEEQDRESEYSLKV